MGNCQCQSNENGKYNLNRRAFLKTVGAGAAAFAVLRKTLPVIAGPFEENEYLKVIPVDKKLDPDWVRSLFHRGQKQVYTNREALEHIGMPVGGLFAGTVYLSGDGRLWLWNIFNRDQEGILPRNVSYKGATVGTRYGFNYVEPAKINAPFEQGFGLRLKGDDSTKNIPLNMEGFEKVSFNGQYPQATVDYESSELPLKATLKAYSPFIPLNVDDSSLPATLMMYTIANTAHKEIEVDIYGNLQNPVCMETRSTTAGSLVNRVVRSKDFSAIVYSAEPSNAKDKAVRPDVLFDDFEKESYDGWTMEGKAFGDGPIMMSDIPDYQGDVAGKGKRVVNSHASAPGKDVGEKDAVVGTLTSKPFKIIRSHIAFLIGGGAHKDATCINLLIDGKAVASATGKNQNKMAASCFDVRSFQGQTARLQIVDNFRYGWGNIGIDEIVFTDKKVQAGRLQDQRDYGTMSLALIGESARDYAIAAKGRQQSRDRVTGELEDKLAGTIGRKLTLKPGESKTVTFVITWHFPNFYGRDFGGQLVGHSYAARFSSALDVARYIAQNFERLTGQTDKWVDTWYDSTLPYWLLDRTMANTSTLATTTCYRFKDGRFWAWEGIGCCAGTCTHVWHYAQALGRLFPAIERDQRKRVDFGMAMDTQGGIGHRAWISHHAHPAHDGQCGRILGAYREHQMSADMSFLKETWPRIKKAVEYLIRLDVNDDGLIEGAQPNTLDAAWYGKVSFLQSLYLAALKAGEAMAIEMGDAQFAERCGKIAARGAKTIEQLYNGEYFVQIEDPSHKDKIGVGPGCYIDQIFGQSWAHQVALGRLFDKEKQLSALRSLWKYNFAPDVGPFRDRFKQGRWYAIAGDAGLVMCTWPKGGQNPNFEKHWQYMYFNECMTGFEWQVASHMIAEGMITEGLAVARAIHDRYDASMRNPYNEIECSDHYARAMASYGAFITACGFECHGPKEHIGFSPRLSPENFKAPFTSAQGWGTFSQQRTETAQKESIEVKWGTLNIKSMAFEISAGKNATLVKVLYGGRNVPADMKKTGSKLVVELRKSLTVETDSLLEADIRFV